MANHDENEMRLFDDACTGCLDEADRAELQELLRSSSEARERYLDYTALHADLFGAVRTARVRELVVGILDEHIVEPQKRSLFASRRSTTATAIAILATAAALLMVIDPRPERRGVDTSSAVAALDPVVEDVDPWPGLVARVNRIEEVVWDQDAKTYVLDEFISGGASVALESGLVEIEFRQGAVVVLEGPAHLIAMNANAASLIRGKLAAVAPPWATGFRIDTPGVDVVDHGTEFAVNVSGDGNDTEVNVVVTEGEVEVLADEQVAGRRLKAGEGVRSKEGAVKDGDDAAARKLTERLPNRPEFKSGVVVGDRWNDWQPGIEGEPARVGAWRYYTNSGGVFGDPNAYEEMVWDEKLSCFRPTDRANDPWMSQYVRVHREGGHPGKGRFQVEDENDRYSITGFVAPEPGRYRIEGGWLERRWAKRWDRDQVLDVAVHVNDKPIVMREYCNRDCFVSFRQELGELEAGDTIYVGVGPNGADFNDKFRWGFYVVREAGLPGASPPGSNADIAAK